MNTPLIASLIGAAAGGALTQHEAGDFAGGTLPGAFLGFHAGSMLTNAARAIRANRLHKELDALPNTSKKDVDKVLKYFKHLKVPVYKQVDGPDMNNAFYTTGGAPMPGIRWKNITTGKIEKNPAKVGVYIGRTFDKLPVLAHELGHAHDFQAVRRWYHSPVVNRLTLAGLVAGPLMTFASAVKAQNEGSDMLIGASAGTKALGHLGMALTMLCGGLKTHWRNKDERAASDKAMLALKTMARKQKLEKYKKMLQAAYGTYDPIQLSEPDFGSGEYAALVK